MEWKKIGKVLLFPPIGLLLLLLPVSIAFLVCAMLWLGTESAGAIAAYVLAAYTLTVWCFKMPYLIRFFKTFREENPYVRRWREDTRLRVNVSLYGSLAWNLAYAVFQLWLGIYHRTVWFCSLAGYYFSLALMRFYLLRHTRKYKPGEQMRTELQKYRACGWIFLGMNLTLSLIVFFMIYWNRTFRHHEITAIAMAAYTFSAFAIAIVGVIRYQQYHSPVYSATRSISLAAACVSILTLESTMLTTFGQDSDPLFRQVMLALTGAAVALLVVVMAIYMIAQSNKKLRELQEETKNGTA